MVGLITKISLIFICLFLIFLVSTLLIIRREVVQTCRKATASYHGKCTDALIRRIQDEKTSITSKNTAIWALGQLADKKSLPFLYDINKGLSVNDKCPYNRCLSQYELQKAVKWCEKGNFTSWMYRGL